MILKKLEVDNKIKSIYTSSTICATIFDTQTKDLTVIFNNGGQYKYPNISLTDYTRLEISESTGSDFNVYIKKKYTEFEKLEKLSDNELTDMLNEIKELKTAEEKYQIALKTKAVIDTMTRLLAIYNHSNKIDSSILKDVQSSIETYNKLANPTPDATPSVV
jgi:hypothetical protein